MTINEKYGLPPIPEHLSFSAGIFPRDFHDLLLKALTEVKGQWSEMEVDTFCHDGTMYLRVVLDVGDRPLYLYLHQDGDVLQIDAPILFDFPRTASYFVLKELCGSTTTLSFRVDEMEVSIDERGVDQRPSVRKTDVLYGWGRYELDVFVEAVHALLLFLIANLTGAEKKLRAFLDSPMQGPVLLDGPLSA
jgi:hypothetical protein